MLSEEEIKKEIRITKQNYENTLNSGDLTRTLQVQMKEKIRVLYFVLKEGNK